MLKQLEFSKYIQPNQKFVYTHNMSVRISDINYGNHLAATAVPWMLHQVRLKFLTAHSFSEANIGGFGLVVVDLYVHYQCESFFDDQLTFQLGIESIDKYGAILIYQISNQTQKKTMGMAKEKILFFDFLKRKIAQTPAIFTDLISELEKESICCVTNFNY